MIPSRLRCPTFEPAASGPPAARLASHDPSAIGARSHAPDDLRQPPRGRPPHLPPLFHRAWLLLQRAVQRRQGALPRARRAPACDAAQARVLPDFHAPQGGRREGEQRGTDLPRRREPRRGGRAGGPSPVAWRHASARAPDPRRLHVRPQLRRSRRPHLGNPLDGSDADDRGRRSLNPMDALSGVESMSTFPRRIPASKARSWTGRILSGLPALFLLADGAMKLPKPAFVVEATVGLGYAESVIVPLGLVLLASTVLYMITPTAVLGAILLTGYLGGAAATHVRAGHGAFEVLFPVMFGVLLWGGLVLRDERLRALFPLRAPAATRKQA